MGRRPGEGDGPEWVRAEIIEPGASERRSASGSDVGGDGASGGRAFGGDGASGRDGAYGSSRNSGSSIDDIPRDADGPRHTRANPVAPDGDGPRAARGGRPGGGPRARWAIGMLATAVAIVGVTAVVRSAGRAPDVAGGNTASATAESTAGPTTGPTAGRTAARSTTATEPSGETPSLLTEYAPTTVAGPALLGDEGGPVTVFALGADAATHAMTVMRLDLASGVEVDTPLPLAADTGPVSLLAGSDGVIVQPFWPTPGFRVTDGRPPSELTGLLAKSWPALPGPDPDTYWVNAARRPSGGAVSMTLVDASGRELGRRIRLPPGAAIFSFPDPSGGILTVGPDGSIVSHADDQTSVEQFPGGRTVDAFGQFARTIGAARLIATSPAGYLTLPCTQSDRCQLTLAGTGGNLKQTMNIPPELGEILYGALSPDGTHAAVVARPRAPRPGDATGGATVSPPTSEAAQAPAAGAPADTPEDAPVLAIFDLADVRVTIATSVMPDPDGGPLVWTPDSHWLLLANADSRLHAVSTDGLRERSALVNVQDITQLVVRAGG